MVDYILGDDKREDRKIVLAVTDAIEHPLLSYPEVAFARLASFTDDEQLVALILLRQIKSLLTAMMIIKRLLRH